MGTHVKFEPLRASLVLAMTLLLGWSPPHEATAAGGAPDETLRRECDYGIALAMGGDTARAESVFVSLLSHAPGDARALNNLGNLALLNGRVESGASFYARALQADSSDPGVRLNQATAFMLLGDEAGALRAATSGIRAAGGPRPAAELLGLVYEGEAPDAPKGDKRTYLSKDEMLLLLKTATRKVPVDSTGADAAGPGRNSKAKRRNPAWRSAGPRAGVDEGAAAFVYWKR